MKTGLAIATLSVFLLVGSLTQSQGLPLGEDIDGARLDWHPDDTMLAITDNQTVEIIDATNLQTINALPAADGYITDVGWSPDGTKFAVSYGFHIDIWSQPWDSTGAQLERTLQAPNDSPMSGIVTLSWHPNGNMLLGVKPEFVHIWDVSNGQLLRTFSPNPTPVLSAAWSPDGSMIALGYLTGTILIEDLSTGALESLEIHDRYAIRSLSWNNIDEHLAAGTASGIIQLMYLGDFLAGAGTIETGIENIVAMDWHPTNGLLAVGSPAGTVAIWDTDTLQMILRIDTGYAIASIKWNSNGDKLAYSNGNGHMSILQFPMTDDDETPQTP